MLGNLQLGFVGAQQQAFSDRTGGRAIDDADGLITHMRRLDDRGGAIRSEADDNSIDLNIFEFQQRLRARLWLARRMDHFQP